ncbi:MAG: hypothetical protein VKJ46_07420 [Leptolyngbyaceae bacterium]|nr:hypothetical protein [Leptolyngbyaceae bacterium]
MGQLPSPYWTWQLATMSVVRAWHYHALTQRGAMNHKPLLKSFLTEDHGQGATTISSDPTLGLWQTTKYT